MSDPTTILTAIVSRNVPFQCLIGISVGSDGGTARSWLMREAFQCLIGISVGSDGSTAPAFSARTSPFQCLIGISVGSDKEIRND